MDLIIIILSCFFELVSELVVGIQDYIYTLGNFMSEGILKKDSQNSKPFFSVIAPVYNTEKYIENCIKSVLNQVYPDFELIIVDDGSPDNSYEIINRYALSDSRVKVVRKENGGLVSARKAGADVAKGKYIVCLDSDDWLEPCCLKIFYDVITEYNSDVVIGAYNRVSNSSSFLCDTHFPEGFYSYEKIRSDIYPILLEDENGRSFQPNIWGRAYKAHLYKKVQSMVPNSIGIGEDRCVVAPLIASCKSLYIVNTAVYNYRIDNNESMTHEKYAFNLSYPNDILDYFLTCYDLDECMYNQVVRKYVHDLYVAYESQFHSYRYFDAKRRIDESSASLRNHLIRSCNYMVVTKGFVAKQAIIWRWYFLMWLTSNR